MQNRTVICPVCGKSFEIGKTLTKVTCNFCGAVFEAPLEKEKIDDEKNEIDSKACFDEAVGALTTKVTTLDSARDVFSKQKYPERFNEYYIEIQKSLINLDRVYGTFAGNKSELIKKYAEAFAKKIKQGVNIDEFKQLKANDYDKVIYLYVAFAVPAILKFKAEYSDELADSLLLTWNRENNRRKLGKATFDTLNAGFKRKWCFITTAVCNTLKRPDDCYELNSFRKFRDNYLVNQQGGREQIQEYYIIAPLIVDAINASPDKDSIYKEIWSKHLSKCLKHYEHSDYEQCRKGYAEMVSILREKWL